MIKRDYTTAETASTGILCRKCGMVNNVKYKPLAEGKRPLCGKCRALLVNRNDMIDLQREARLALSPFNAPGEEPSLEEVHRAFMEEWKKDVVWD